METLRSSIHTALSDPRIKNQIKERETDLLRQLERELNGKLPKSSRSNSATDGELPIDHGDTK
jgi:hypothetical protein